MVWKENKARYAGDVGAPATKYTAVNINREEEQNTIQRKGTDDVPSSKPKGRLGTDALTLKVRNAPFKIGTWNVRTLFQAGKLDNLMQEMDSMKINILGISETRWTGNGVMKKEKYSIYYSGGEQHEHGVAIVLQNKIANSLLGVWQINKRMIMCKLQAKPFNIVLIQVYAPTSEYSDEEVEMFYEEIEIALRQTKSSDIVIVMGDFNAKVGHTAMSKCMGRHGLGQTNERGEMLLQFCEKHDMTMINTLFKQPKRKLYTWKSPGDVTRNQIDYLLIKSRFRNSISTCKTYPGADIGSDHNPVVMKMQVKLKTPNTKVPKTIKLDVSPLKQENYKFEYSLTIKNRYECLMNQANEEESESQDAKKEIDKMWTCVRDAIKDTNEKMLKPKTFEKKQEWMTDDILKLMKSRKECKGTDQYKVIDKMVKNECKNAKEKWLNEKCSDIETLSLIPNQRAMYEKIKEFTKKGNTSGGCIKDKGGNILFETEHIMKRWKEYVEELFDADRSKNPIQSFLQGPAILEEETKHALKTMSSGKACGVDDITTEMLRALDEFGVATLTTICNKMYETAYIPEELRTSVFILLPKKPNAVECSDFRTISLMCHTLKLLLTIILKRIKDKIDSEVGRNQAGFRKDSGTREAIFNLKIISEKYIEKNKDIYACFIDYSKAFDTVNHEKLIESLRKVDIDENDIALLSNLYWEQLTKVKLNNTLTDSVKIKRGVRQGCVLSPSLFNIYTEFIFREIEDAPGLQIGGVRINNLRYADDTVILAESEEDLQNLVTTVKEESEKYGLLMNVKKTKTLSISKKKDKPRINIIIDGKSVEQVESFVYLGQVITEDGRSETEVKRRIGIAKNTFMKLKQILTSSNVSVQTRLRLNKCYIWSTFTYGCETWTLTADLEKRIDAFEMWLYRRITRTS